MATVEQVRRVQEVRDQRHADWEAVHNDEHLAMLSRLQEQDGLNELKELNRLQTKLVRPIGRAAEDFSGVAVAALTAGVFADHLPTYATPDIEPQLAVAPVETRRNVGTVALSQQLRTVQSTPNLATPEIYTGYAA